MGRCRVIIMLVAVLGAVLIAPSVAFGGSQVLLAYGQPYDADGTQRTHRGIDLASAEGEMAASLVAGEVTFAGRIPSDSGGSVYAITVRTADELVTLHPLDECWVSVGNVVSEGEGIGTVAGSGDGSSSTTHLHLSVRVAETYVDPSYLLQAPAPEPHEAEGAEASEAVPVAAATPLAVGGVALTVTSPVTVGGPAAAHVPVPAGAAPESEVRVPESSIAGPTPARSPEVESPTSALGSTGAPHASLRTTNRYDVPDLSAGARGLLAALAAGAAVLAFASGRRGRLACTEVD